MPVPDTVHAAVSWHRSSQFPDNEAIQQLRVVFCRSSLPGNEVKDFLSIKPWLSEHQISLSECDSVPKERHVVATGASPWTGVKNYGESRRDDMNPAAQTHVVPLGLKNAIFGTIHGLAPVATTCRHCVAKAQPELNRNGIDQHCLFPKKSPYWHRLPTRTARLAATADYGFL